MSIKAARKKCLENGVRKIGYLGAQEIKVMFSQWRIKCWPGKKWYAATAAASVLPSGAIKVH